MSEPVHVYIITHLPSVSGLPRAREVEIWRGDTYRSYAVAVCGKPLRKHISMCSYNRAVRYKLSTGTEKQKCLKETEPRIVLNFH